MLRLVMMQTKMETRMRMLSLLDQARKISLAFAWYLSHVVHSSSRSCFYWGSVRYYD